MIPRTGAVLAPAKVSSGAQGIPFRQESSGIGGDAAYVLLILVLLLAATAALLWLAKKKGWLAQWVPSTNPSQSAGLRVEHALRLSGKTTVYQLADARDRYLLVESSAAVELTVLPRTSENKIS